MHINCDLASPVDQRVDFSCFLGRALASFFKVTGNFSLERFSNQVESSVTRKEGPDVSMCDLRFNGKFSRLPPVVSQRDGAATHGKVDIAKAVVIKQQAASQSSVHALAVHAVHQNFAIAQFQSRYVGGLRDNDRVLDCPGAIKQAPCLFFWEISFDRDRAW